MARVLPPALRHAFVRIAVTVAGLVIYWQLGLQDTHSLGKAAGFTLIANLGLGGLALLLCWRRASSLAALLLNGLVLATAGIEGFLFWLYGMNPKHIAVADAIRGSNPEEVGEFLSSYGIHMLLIAALPVALTACWPGWNGAGAAPPTGRQPPRGARACSAPCSPRCSARCT
jgi:glucan phosphoethanolaminetransferase (alkaline phosphatase superfamily)